MPVETPPQDTGADGARGRALVPRGPVVLVAALLIALSAGLVLPHIRKSPWGSANSKSRYATVETLVDHGTFAIDQSEYRRTMDRVKIDGKLYSSKPPTLSVFTAGIYWAVQKTTGWNIRDHEHAVVFTCNLLTVFALHVLLLVYFFRFICLLVKSEVAALVALAAACFSFLGTGYAVDLNNHTPAATLGLMSFYYAYRGRHGDPRPDRSFALSGLFAGFLPGIDLPAGALSAGIGLYLLTADVRRTLRWFVPFALPGVAIHLFLTWLSSGSLIPVYLRKELYEYNTTPRSRDSLPGYAFHMLIGHHGIFSMTPALLFALPALYGALRRRAERFPEALLVAGVWLVLLAFYVTQTHNYGGVCVGFRWAIAYTPLLFLFLGVWLDRALPSRLVWALVVAALGIGHLHVQNALDNPWQNSRWQSFITGLGRK